MEDINECAFCNANSFGDCKILTDNFPVHHNFVALERTKKAIFTLSNEKCTQDQDGREGRRERQNLVYS